jgi:phenylacetate-CoA ligase
MIDSVYRRIAFPLTDVYRNTTSVKCLAELEKTQWLSTAELEELQRRKLKPMLKHAYENVPFYHRMFRDLGLKPEDVKGIGDLMKLPVLTKDDIRSNFPNDIVSKDSRKWNPKLATTSGSTGEPLRFYRDKGAVTMAWASLWRGWGFGGYKLGDKITTLGGTSLIPIGGSRAKSKVMSMVTGIMERNMILSAFDLKDDAMEGFVQRMREYEPKYLRGYSSAYYVLAKYLRDKDINDIRPDAILTTGEILYSEHRKLIEEQFGCSVFDGYGSGEYVVGAFECEEHHGYHIFVEGGIMEFVKDGEHASPGEKGELIVTSLCNYAMPFIRYRIEDIGVPSDEKCACGRGLPLMASIEGRVGDFVISDDGTMTPSEFFPHLIKDAKGIKQFQIVQKSRRKLVFRIVKGSGYTDKEIDEIVEKIKKQVGSGMEVELEFMESIPVTSAGKRLFVISEMNEGKFKGNIK